VKGAPFCIKKQKPAIFVITGGTYLEEKLQIILDFCIKIFTENERGNMF
jgi:hypothetical protein